jgi:hypothetical protein
MGDTPTTQSSVAPVSALLAQSIPSDVHSVLMDQVHSLAKKHFQISGLLIVVLVGVLTLGGFGAYFGAKWVDRALARAEKSEELYKADKAVSDKSISDLKTQLSASDAARAASDERVKNLQNQLGDISKRQQDDKNNILKPGKTATDAFTDANKEYKLTSPLDIVQSPDKTEQLLAFRVPDVQLFSATKVDLDAALATIKVKDGIISEREGKIKTLTDDLAKTNSTLADLQKTDKQCQDALDKYKNVAKVTKFKKILHGAIKGLEIGGAIVLGYEIGHVLKK